MKRNTWVQIQQKIEHGDGFLVKGKTIVNDTDDSETEILRRTPNVPVLQGKDINECRKCGKLLHKKADLRCEACRKEVDRELNNEQDETFNYYFIYYQETR